LKLIVRLILKTNEYGMKKTKIKGFDEAARNPKTWLFESKCHEAVAKVLWEHSQNSLFKDVPLEERNGVFRTAFLHAGLAVENAAKAVLISRDPSIVSNGRIDYKKFRGKGSHPILTMVQHAVHKLNSSEENLLKNYRRM
jgi:hypothetical protein